MPKKRFSAEQIVTVLRQIEVLMSQGKAAPVACREAGISQQSCATSASTGKSSTACRRLLSSSSNGATTTTRSDRTHLWTTGHPHLEHRRQQCSIWIGAQRCNNLRPVGPKYPSAHTE